MNHAVSSAHPPPPVRLVAIKAMHTAVWAFFAACIVALPVAGWLKRFDTAAAMGGCVLLECAVLALNRGKCPLTPMAARYTSDRSPAFDIYLPTWIAKWNKILFGSLFVINALLVLGLWLAHRGVLRAR